MMDLFVLRLRFEVLFGFLISSTLICVLIIVYSFGLMRIELKVKLAIEMRITSDLCVCKWIFCMQIVLITQISRFRIGFI